MPLNRSLVLLFASLVLAACNFKGVPDPAMSDRDRAFLARVPTQEMDLPYERYEVDDTTGETPGTIVVDTKRKFLFFVLPNKRAIRYGVATGAEAYGWTGKATVARKGEWPHWTPPADMVARWPHLKPTLAAGVLPGGPDNPLGARALYLYEGNRDTLYRIHGTNEPETIGHDASSGCIRMRNVDVIDLFNRVPVGTQVIVR